MRPLSWKDITSNHAPLRVRLAARGIPCWSEEAIGAYMRAQYAAQPTPRPVLYFCLILAACVTVGLTFSHLASPLGTLAPLAAGIMSATAGLFAALLLLRRFPGLFERLEWQTSTVSYGRYWRDWKVAEVPYHVQKIILNVWNFEREVRFSVSFIGKDPILWATGPHGDKVAILVWDENRDGSITVVEAPRD